jgi:hypothetical protein
VGVRGGVAGLLIDVDPVDRGMEALVDVTRRIEGVAARTAVAAADIEVAVGAEVQVAAVMVSRRIELGDERLLGLGVYLERLDARQQETGDALMELTINPKTIIDKDLLVFLVLRMDGETEETALAGGVELPVLGVKLEDLRGSRPPSSSYPWRCRGRGRPSRSRRRRPCFQAEARPRPGG